MIQIHGFTLEKEQSIPEIKTRARLFRHAKTGAELLSLENDDENKVFGIAFRTPPADSTGVAHIMEHSVLCGSRKYPVKEPFVELIKGSLNTFLNAFTFPDKTCFPVASQNLKDFYNLIDVYLDAVFYPLIPLHILEQEGWHYELENPDDPLSLKGVVFNEMKGGYSSPDNLLETYVLRSLFPSNPYRFDSGGDPKDIPNLTYTQFKDFHDTHYHPSNARIYFYGDDDPEERLRLLNEYLKEFEPLEVESAVPHQPAFTNPRREVYQYDAGSDIDRKGMVSVNWLLSESSGDEIPLALSILAHILIGTPASPLYKALIDSGLGEDLTRGGLETHLRQMVFSVGLKGIAVEDADRVEALIMSTMQSLAENGLDEGTVAASLNTVEFNLRENNTGRFPRGLALMLRALTTWNYDQDPVGAIAFEKPLDAIKHRLETDERYFENLITRFFLDNPHRTTVILEPDLGLKNRKEAEERQHLASIKSKFSQSDLAGVVENTEKLKRIQETPDPPEALATLPVLRLADLERDIKRIPLDKVALGGVPVYYHDLFTNGILYFDLGFDLHALPQELLPYLPLFSQGLLEMGTEKEDFVQLTQRIGSKTGGLSPARLLSAVKGQTSSAAWFLLRGKCTMAQTGDLLAIIRDVLLTVKLDNQERFLQLVLRAKAEMEAGLIPGGHTVVNSRLRSHFGESSWVSEQMGGLSNLFFTRDLVQEVKRNWPVVLEKLKTIRSLLINRKAALCNVTLDAENWAQFQPQLAEFLSEVPSQLLNLQTWSPERSPTHEGFTLPAQVNYVGKGANLYEQGYTFDGSVLVVNKYLNTSWLWEKVRVQGGAYGGFSAFDRLSGVFSYLSYRDPNLLATLEVYDHTSDFLENLELSPDELTKIIIGTIGDLDAYMLPDAKGYVSLLRQLVGVTDADRQKIRDRVLSTSVSDFKNFAGVLRAVRSKGHVVVLGSEEALQSAREHFGPKSLPVRKVL